MKTYRISLEVRVTDEQALLGAALKHAMEVETQTAAHTVAREFPRREDVRIELLDVPTKKANIVELLNHAAKGTEPTYFIERTWSLTARGGMVSCANGE